MRVGVCAYIGERQKDRQKYKPKGDFKSIFDEAVKRKEVELCTGHVQTAEPTLTPENSATVGSID